MTDALRKAAQAALDAMERYQVKRQDFDRFYDEVIALRAALAVPDDVMRDAERYLWLRSRIRGNEYRNMGVIYSEGGEGINAAIDAAMACKNAEGEA